MATQSLYQVYKRIRSLQSNRISSLPVVILIPHSACNCRCVMCDIWKGNQHLEQLDEAALNGLLETFGRYGTRRVVMSGGEALLHPKFFRFCEILKKEKIKISLLSTGLTLKKNAAQLVQWVDDIIVSLDGDGALHDAIRNIPGAFSKLKEGIEAVRAVNPAFRITGRTVIHGLNFRHWVAIVHAAKEIGLNRISFLPADVSSTAFNRDIPWSADRQLDILVAEPDLPELQAVIDDLGFSCNHYFTTGFIAESPQKIQKIHDYYAACYGHRAFPYKKCNAPWVSAVVEAGGAVRPCFFHAAYGNIKSAPLDTVINSDAAIAFRKGLDMDKNETCIKCVCYLNLSPAENLG